jgi:hypothetical protein
MSILRRPSIWPLMLPDASRMISILPIVRTSDWPSAIRT